jgi:hypothetical protein
MNAFQWSKTEKKIAKEAFESAYLRECEALAQKVREMAANITKPEELWSIQDLLTQKRREIDRKYDYRYSVLILVFASLMKDGWLSEADLSGFREDKIEKIKSMAHRWGED